MKCLQFPQGNQSPYSSGKLAITLPKTWKSVQKQRTYSVYFPWGQVGWCNIKENTRAIGNARVLLKLETYQLNDNCSSKL